MRRSTSSPRRKAVESAKNARAFSGEGRHDLDPNDIMRALLTNYDNVPAFMTEGYIALGNGNYRASGRRNTWSNGCTRSALCCFSWAA